MTPSEYELRVAEYFRLRGYAVRCTPASNDYGVDAFAEKGMERLAVQAKMYGDGSRLVNRDVVMHLYGAKDYFDCTAAVIVTDGILMDDAAAVARKLRVEVLTLEPDQLPKPIAGTVTTAPDKVGLRFHLGAVRNAARRPCLAEQSRGEQHTSSGRLDGRRARNREWAATAHPDRHFQESRGRASRPWPREPRLH
jgi:hypothetical protein